ncbi:hypothetical protein BGZ83_005406 [Gryganskiella cystojenkinii]|nr:hypothetical protein BGZ83_005406 [Gryganskiella cystojenkinii]
MDVITRWNTTLALLERGEILYDAMMDVLNMLTHGDHADPEAAAKLRERMLSPQMRERARTLISLLKPVF